MRPALDELGGRSLARVAVARSGPEIDPIGVTMRPGSGADRSRQVVNLRVAAQLILEQGEAPEEAHEPLAPGAFRASMTVLA